MADETSTMASSAIDGSGANDDEWKDEGTMLHDAGGPSSTLASAIAVTGDVTRDAGGRLVPPRKRGSTTTIRSSSDHKRHRATSTSSSSSSSSNAAAAAARDVATSSEESGRRRRAYYYSLASCPRQRRQHSSSSSSSSSASAARRTATDHSIGKMTSSSSRGRNLRSSSNSDNNDNDKENDLNSEEILLSRCLGRPRRSRVRAPLVAATTASEGGSTEGGQSEDVEMPRMDNVRRDCFDGGRGPVVGKDDDVALLLLGDDVRDAAAELDVAEANGRRDQTPFDDIIRDDFLGSVGCEDQNVEDDGGEKDEEEEEEEEEEEVVVVEEDRFSVYSGRSGHSGGRTNDLLDALCEIDGGEGRAGSAGDDGSERSATARFDIGLGSISSAPAGDGYDGFVDEDVGSDSPVYSVSRSHAAPDRRDDDLRDDDGGPAESEIDSANAEAQGAANVPMGAKELLPLWNRITEKMTCANCRYDRKFYGHLKHYLSKQSKRALPSDVKQVEAFLVDFDTTMKELDDRRNDFDAICNYGGWVECIIEEAKERLSPAPVNVAPNGANLIAGVKVLRPLWNQIMRKLADAECQYERIFYGHLKWYLSRRSKQSHGRVPLSDLDRINECLDEFETTLDRLNDKRNDYDDLRFYGSLIENVIETCKGQLSLVE